MPDPTRQEAVGRLKGAVGTALWVGLKPDEIKAVVVAHLLERTGK